MYGWAKDLFPICRSITGDGVRQTLGYLGRLLPGLEVHEIPSGTQAFDWAVPDEWNIRSAYIEDENGNRIIDFANNNLHVVGYSEPIDEWLTLDELRPHLHSRPDMPDAIPYVTSYYKRNWGFCLAHNQLQSLKPGRYRAVIDSDLEPGSMSYGELLLPGREETEILLSTYVCHPSMANNELSGPVVTTALARWIASQENRRFSYRILFLPETIGALAYMSNHLKEMKSKTVAGYVVTCIGDDRVYSYMPSRSGDTLADRAALHALKGHAPDYIAYSFLERASDERQYCSPGADLPVASIMRSAYHHYPEYHTSLDDLSVISPQGLEGGFSVLTKAISLIEANQNYRATMVGEPRFSKYGLFPKSRSGDDEEQYQVMKNIMAYADGSKDLLEIAETIGVDAMRCVEVIDVLVQNGLLTTVSSK